MKKLLIIFLIFLFSCEEENTTNIYELNYNSINNYSIDVNELNLSIKDLNDYRCPLEKLCDSLGYVELYLNVHNNNLNEFKEIKLNTNNIKNDIIYSYTISLINVLPVKYYEKVEENQMYSIYLKIENKY